jgi:hypothetical protein
MGVVLPQTRTVLAALVRSGFRGCCCTSGEAPAITAYHPPAAVTALTFDIRLV